MLSSLRSWSEQGWIRALDYQFAKLISQVEGVPDELVLLAALVSNELATGNVCLPMSRLQNPLEHWERDMADVIARVEWEKNIRFFLEVLGDGCDENITTPLVLDQERIYLYRYWRYEVYVAEQLLQRANACNVEHKLLENGLSNLFPTNTDAELDWQKIAAAVAVQKRFSVISGGPGTGKTTTVIKLLALYIQQMQALGIEPNIKLAAPTGKAAARLSESISAAKLRLDLSEEIAEQIPTEASTLHRLLGVIPNSIQFRHDQTNPLHLDLLVLDEASMVDLPMMSRLLDAMPETARLILLGDRDQLASVEAGSVLGDICSWPGELGYSDKQSEQLQNLCQISRALPANQLESKFADSLALLRKSYRFDENSGIGFLARAVNSGNSQSVAQVLEYGYQDLTYLPLSRDSYETLIKDITVFYVELFRQVMSGGAPLNMLKKLSEFQTLCALREGPYGVSGINDRIRSELSARALIKTDTAWYPGRPIMISRNDTSLSLFNGDIGLALYDEDGRLKVWFEQDGGVRAVLPSRLPDHDTVFAMTVHKSQGSEFEHVMMLLPPDDNPVLSRELLYTGITRAKNSLQLCAQGKVLKLATERKTERAGGLALRLWQ
ncbi:MAG: exodeoxyribonuclease V subunit alpha [Neptuniibacter sp.]|nr:exodeoxyribonuclease V subunit alpha [Neptuniibacter sp.]